MYEVLTTLQAAANGIIVRNRDTSRFCMKFSRYLIIMRLFVMSTSYRKPKEIPVGDLRSTIAILLEAGA